MGPAQNADLVHVDDTGASVRLTLVTASGDRITAALPPAEAATIGTGLHRAALTVSGRQA